MKGVSRIVKGKEVDCQKRPRIDLRKCLPWVGQGDIQRNDKRELESVELQHQEQR